VRNLVHNQTIDKTKSIDTEEYTDAIMSLAQNLDIEPNSTVEGFANRYQAGWSKSMCVCQERHWKPMWGGSITVCIESRQGVSVADLIELVMQLLNWKRTGSCSAKTSFSEESNSATWDAEGHCTTTCILSTVYSMLNKERNRLGWNRWIRPEFDR
jgi:hypothetical protein